MKKRRFVWIVLILPVTIFFLGPEPSKPKMSTDLPVVSSNFDSLGIMIRKREASLPVRPDNEARILWAGDSIHELTDYCLLYIHGFKASYYEGYPINTEFAKRYGCNAYFPRLASHGLITDDPLIDMTPDRLWEDAKESLMIARKLGRKVIIMCTSMGCSLGLQLAADYPEYVNGLILYSPNVRINNSAAYLLSGHWGLQIGRLFSGGKYRVTDDDPNSMDCRYWYCKYRVEGVVYLQQLVEATMKDETYSRVTAPVFMGYYFKDKEHQDPMAKVSAMLDMFDKLGTTDDRKVKQAFPDAGAHVIASEVTSGAVEAVKKATFNFAEEILDMKPYQK